MDHEIAEKMARIELRDYDSGFLFSSQLCFLLLIHSLLVSQVYSSHQISWFRKLRPMKIARIRKPRRNPSVHLPLVSTLVAPTNLFASCCGMIQVRWIDMLLFLIFLLVWAANESRPSSPGSPTDSQMTEVIPSSLPSSPESTSDKTLSSKAIERMFSAVAREEALSHFII